MLHAPTPKHTRRWYQCSARTLLHWGRSRPLTNAVLFVLLFATWTAVDRMQAFNATAIVAGIGAIAIISWIILVRIALNRVGARLD
jgi:hypothetical protein